MLEIEVVDLALADTVALCLPDDLPLVSLGDDHYPAAAREAVDVLVDAVVAGRSALAPMIERGSGTLVVVGGQPQPGPSGVTGGGPGSSVRDLVAWAAQGLLLDWSLAVAPFGCTVVQSTDDDEGVLEALVAGSLSWGRVVRAGAGIQTQPTVPVVHVSTPARILPVRLRDAVAVVTGAAGAIGSAYARSLAAAGARVALLDRNPSVVGIAQDIQQRTGGRCLGIMVDLTDDAACARAWTEVHAGLGIPQVLIANAAVYEQLVVTAPLGEARAYARRMFEGNILGAIGVANLLARDHPAAGAIVLVTTDHVLPALATGDPRRDSEVDAYDSSKWALNGLLQAWALEVGPDVAVNAIAMGAVDTPMTRGYFPDGAPSELVSLWSTPGQQAEALISLLGDDRTGQLVPLFTGRPVVIPPASAVGAPFWTVEDSVAAEDRPIVGIRMDEGPA